MVQDRGVSSPGPVRARAAADATVVIPPDGLPVEKAPERAPAKDRARCRDRVPEAAMPAGSSDPEDRVKTNNHYR